MRALRRALSFVALVCAVAVSAPALSQTAPNSPVIRVGAGPDTQSVPLLYADKAGLYKKYGLNVQIVKLSGAAAVAAALAGGSLEIGKGSPVAVITAFAKGLPFTVIGDAAFYDSAHPDIALVVGNNSGVSSAKDLIGKTLASVTLQDLNSLATFAWLEQHGVDQNSVKWTEIPASAVAPAIDAGRIAGSTLYEPFFSTTMATGKVKILGYPYDAISKRFAAAVLFSTSSWATAHPDLVNKFLRATQEAAVYLSTHDAESNALIAEFGGLDPATLPNIKQPERGVPMLPSDIQPVIDILAKYKVIPQTFPAANMICTCALKR